MLIKIEILTRREDLHARFLLTKTILLLQQNKNVWICRFSTKNYLMKQNKLSFQGINMHNFFSNDVDRKNNRITWKSTCNFKCSVFLAKSGTPSNDNAIQRARRDWNKNWKTNCLKENIHSFKVLVLTFWAICQSKLLLGMNHIVI